MRRDINIVNAPNAFNTYCTVTTGPSRVWLHLRWPSGPLADSGSIHPYLSLILFSTIWYSRILVFSREPEMSISSSVNVPLAKLWNGLPPLAFTSVSFSSSCRTKEMDLVAADDSIDNLVNRLPGPSFESHRLRHRRLDEVRTPRFPLLTSAR